MIAQDFILLLRETVCRFNHKQPESCFLKPPCGCPHPGQELRCEECPYLEACLSRFRSVGDLRRDPLRAKRRDKFQALSR